jgi:hypothetical protein
MQGARLRRYTKVSPGRKENIMNRSAFEAICRAVTAGEEKYLENVENHHAGRAVACSGETVEIDIFGKRESWPLDRCEEVAKPHFDYHR